MELSASRFLRGAVKVIGSGGFRGLGFRGLGFRV